MPIVQNYLESFKSLKRLIKNIKRVDNAKNKIFKTQSAAPAILTIAAVPTITVPSLIYASHKINENKLKNSLLNQGIPIKASSFKQGSIDKIAATINLQDTLSEARRNASLQPLNNKIMKPRNMSDKLMRSTRTSSRLKDNRILHKELTYNS